jgi:hypothetical protein
MEYDPRVIIKFLLNEGAHARDIADRLQTGCRYSLVNMLINFERFNPGLQKYDSVAETSIIKFALEDILWMISMLKF